MRNGKDKGFNYWKLNYKRKFFRTLWLIPVVIIITFQLLIMMQPDKVSTVLVIAIIVILIAQLLYTYTKWKNEERIN